jgi:predicted house-cleaning noncanonical NTP pyrophosphatase (MazG superfamily)
VGAKLIRDKMKDLPWGDEEAKKGIYKVVGDDEYFGLLMAKFFEEIGELLYAASLEPENDEAMMDELVDVYTVLLMIIKRNVPWEDFLKAFDKKLEEKGDFEEGWAWNPRHANSQPSTKQHTETH